MKPRLLILACSCALALFAGCERKHAPSAVPPPPPAVVSLPLEREIMNYEYFTGQTRAVESVDVRARVTGYLQKIYYQADTEVKVGDPLFLIDPRQYQAKLDQAKAALDQAKAQLDVNKKKLTRDLEIAKTPGAISQQNLDVSDAAVKEAAAAVEGAKANLEYAQLNLNWTKVISPIKGRIDRNLLTEGNLVNADTTLLTNIISVKPMYAYFNVDERTVQDINKMVREGKFKTKEEIPFWVGLQTEEGFPHQGHLDSAMNQLDSNTGTLQVRGVLPNDDLALVPGYFVRVRVPVSEPRKMLLVAERALGTDQGQRFVLVVDEDNKIEYRKIKVGMLADGLRVIAEGLKPTDQVVVRGLQRMRAGMTVTPQRIPMPTQAEETAKP